MEQGKVIKMKMMNLERSRKFQDLNQIKQKYNFSWIRENLQQKSYLVCVLNMMMICKMLNHNSDPLIF
jgi:hypothetical protein